MLPRVSVIMRTKNCASVVSQALAALFSQSMRDFELIVVDSGSTDSTLEVVRAYPCTLIEIPAEEYYPAAVLNHAAAIARGEILVFQNSDVVPLTPDALTHLLAPFASPEVDATFARQVARPEAHGWVRRDYEVAFPPTGDPPEFMTYSLPLAAMRRSVWAERPFYDAAWGSEDTEWGTWARANGRVIRYVADALVMHSHNYTLKQMYGRRFIEGEADAFIQGGNDSAVRAAIRVARSIAGDVRAMARTGDVGGIVMSPARRFVYHYAYLRGHKLGEKRIATADGDKSLGQTVVLARQ